MGVEVNPLLQKGYDEQYNADIREWRELGGKYKVENILALSRSVNARKVLDCGAGEGSVLKWLDESGRFESLYALEISDSGLSHIKGRRIPSLREALKFDGYKIPYEDHAFDIAIATHVLEHVEHPRVLLRELKRVSRRQIMEVPLDYRIGIDHDALGQLRIGHINIFTPSLFRFLLRSEGFEVEEQRLTKLHRDVIRYNWYRNERRRFDLIDEAKLLLSPVLGWARRLRQGRAHYEEFAYDALTVRTSPAGDAPILKSTSGTPAS